MNTIDQTSFKDKKALIRVDFNVPLDKDFNITDDKRMRAALPTINKILNDGGSVVLMSHLGRPKGGPEDKYSLKHILGDLSRMLDVEVKFATDCIGDDAENKAKNLFPGEVLLLENLRFHPEEEKGDHAFAEKLAKLGNVYVNDAFGTAHRAEGTTYGIAQYAPIACAGPLLSAEIDAITKALASPQRPLVAIVAGSKVSTKLTILKSLASKVDQLIVGGGIANTFLLASGHKIGKSLAEPDLLEEAKSVIEIMRARGAAVPIPTDVVTATQFSKDATATVKQLTEINEDDLILDIGPVTANALADQLKMAGTIVWNGPVGVFEFDAFENGTRTIAQAIAQSSAFSIAGGGDTLAAIAKYDIENQVGYISTGGGAFLEILEGKTLPAVEILMQRAAQDAV